LNVEIVLAGDVLLSHPIGVVDDHHEGVRGRLAGRQRRLARSCLRRLICFVTTGGRRLVESAALEDGASRGIAAKLTE
jgi:hypothetical protein